MKKTSSKYMLILGVLTLVILGSQILMQTTIKGSKSDARIINISGRQRMLSQKITKASLKLMSSKDSNSFDDAKKKLNTAAELWSRSHEDLKYGSNEIDVNEMNKSNALLLLYDDIEPFFEVMSNAVTYLGNMNYEASTDSLSRLKMITKIEAITKTEGDFLFLMNKITFQYDKLASSKIEQLSTVEFYLMGFTFLLILLEAFFIFRPMLVDSKKKDLALSELNELRDGDRVYASSQILEANNRIKTLRRIALKFKEELDSKSIQFSERMTQQMTDYAKLSGEYEKNKTRTESLKSAIHLLENKINRSQQNQSVA